MKDPVCGMEVNVQEAQSIEIDGNKYYFCSQRCLDKFTQKQTVPSEPKISKGQEYICPMHPDVVSDKPGDCPKCGMALELKVPQLSRGKTIYTCPMHPEIEQDHPGNVPSAAWLWSLSPALRITKEKIMKSQGWRINSG